MQWQSFCGTEHSSPSMLRSCHRVCCRSLPEMFWLRRANTGVAPLQPPPAGRCGSAWTEDDWYADWWYENSADWSSDWSWSDDSSWNWPSNVPFPPPTQQLMQGSTSSSSAAKAAPIVPQAPPQTAAAIIARPPGLSRSDRIANQSILHWKLLCPRVAESVWGGGHRRGTPSQAAASP